MKISMASLALAMLAEVATARWCTRGLDYCGRTLKSIGIIFYRDSFANASTNVGQATTRTRSRQRATTTIPMTVLVPGAMTTSSLARTTLGAPFTCKPAAVRVVAGMVGRERAITVTLATEDDILCFRETLSSSEMSYGKAPGSRFRSWRLD